MKKLLIGLMAIASFAATAASFSYQGVLKKADGTNFADTDRNPEITFRLYTVPTGGTALWGRKVKVLLDKDGLFNVELSDLAGSAVAGLANTLDQVLSQYGSSALYIGMEVDELTGEIRPRQKLPAVPLASFAQDVNTARNGFSVTGTLTVNGEAISPIPRGVIVMWSGSEDSIPSGWALCNGANGTPDLRDRFIVGADKTYAVGATGGMNEVKLTVSQMPSHNHNYNSRVNDLTQSYSDLRIVMAYSPQYNQKKYVDDYTSVTGGNQPHENRPPYYALYFIMKL